MVITNSSTLNDRYAIQSVLGEVGPFDVSYLAWDTQEECKVVLREYYPLQFSKRASDGLTLEVNDPKNFEYGLGAYTAEAHRLIDIEHPNVINYQTNFKENGTIYSVSAFIPGASTYGHMTQQGGALGEEEALTIIGSVLAGLHACHNNNLFHGGVWPKAIHLTPESTPILMGFSQARFQLAKHCEKFEQVHLPGFTAPEQAYKEVQAGPWWDIFGTAATLFYMLSGYQLNYQREKCTEDDIKSALHRETSISADLRPVLEKALAFNYKDRFDSLEGFQHALEEATTKKTLLSMHTNGHHTNGQSYATSISALPGAATSQIAIDDDIIDVKELPSEKEPIKETVQPVSRETKPKMDQEKQPATQLLDTPDIDKQNTSIIQQEPSRPPMLLEQPKAKAPEPQAPTEKSDKEVAQLLSKMVKWQQTLIAFILGFVFLVLLGTIALFAGPQLIELVKNSTSGTSPEVQSAALAAASGAPLATADSTGESITQADIDSMYATIRAQLEEELSNSIAAQREPQPRISTEPSSIPVPRQPEPEEENIASNSSSTPDEVDNNEPPANTEAEEGDSQDEAPEEELLASDEAAEDGIDASELSQEDQVNEMLKEREFQMYRTMGDSLMAQGFDELALQWYQSALQQDPNDTYVAEQINRIEEVRSQVTAAEAAADSLSQLIQSVTDENGIFFNPDSPPLMIDEARVHSSVRYPRNCLSRTNGGRVIARAVVDETGTPSDLMIAKSLHTACDKEVLRVLSEAQFEPAFFNGQPVKAWYAFSVVFREK